MGTSPTSWLRSRFVHFETKEGRTRHREWPRPEKKKGGSHSGVVGAGFGILRRRNLWVCIRGHGEQAGYLVLRVAIAKDSALPGDVRGPFSVWLAGYPCDQEIPTIVPRPLMSSEQQILHGLLQGDPNREGVQNRERLPSRWTGHPDMGLRLADFQVLVTCYVEMDIGRRRTRS